MSENGARLTGRWLVAKAPTGEPMYSLIVGEAENEFRSSIDGEMTKLVSYLSPSGIRRTTTERGVREMVESGKVVLV